jgi:6-pyruvoyltetrahydropterin/6-carboxytetrahydropterin synthase
MHYSTKIIELGSCAFRQPKAKSHCRFIHGYRLTAKFWFAANELDENNWVVDFGSLKELKQLLQDQFDHTTCVSKHDPHLDEFIKLEKLGLCDLKIMDGVGIEKFAEWCHAAADNFAGVLTKLRCRCVRVEVFEHENNSAIYESYPEQKTQSTSEQVEQTQTVTKKATKSDTQPNQPTEPTKPVPKKHGQRKTEGKWVDPKYKGRTKNTWLF